MEENVSVSFLTLNGKFMARVSGPTHGNVLLRRVQYLRADDDVSKAHIAVSIIAGKILNCRTVLQRALRDHPETPKVKKIELAVKELKRQQIKLSYTNDVDHIRGIEGNAGKIYFSAFPSLILTDETKMLFEKRTRRPPLDPVNALLSFSYTLLMHDVRSALECVGLDPQVGYLHAERPGRHSLALDMMEELRPVIADRLALSLINKKILREKHFAFQPTGAVLLKDDARKIFLKAYQEKKATEIIHPYIKEKMTVGLIPHIQAQLLARYLRGDLDAYPPFIWK